MESTVARGLDSMVCPTAPLEQIWTKCNFVCNRVPRSNLGTRGAGRQLGASARCARFAAPDVLLFEDMRKFLLPLVAILSLAGAAFAADITADDAKSHAGDTVTVRGTVTQVIVARTGNVFVNFGGEYPNHVFSAVLLAKRTPGLAEGGKTWLTDLKDKNVSVTGKIEMNEGKPQIVLSAREDIHAN